MSKDTRGPRLDMSNLSEHSIELLESTQFDLERDMAEVKKKIEEATGAAASEGTFYDVKWLASARFALRAMGRDHQIILLELGKRRKKERRSYNDSFERFFMDSARARLDAATFDAIWAEARALADSRRALL